MEQTYRPVIDPLVRAVPVTPETIEWAAAWCKGKPAKELDPLEKTEKIIGVNVVTQSGVKLAQWGYFIVKKMNGEFKVYHPLAFKLKYTLSTMCKPCGGNQCADALGNRECPCCNKHHEQ